MFDLDHPECRVHICEIPTVELVTFPSMPKLALENHGCIFCVFANLLAVMKFLFSYP